MRRYGSFNWWREVLGSRVRACRKAIGFRPYVFEKSIENETIRFYVATPTGDSWYGRDSDTNDLEMRYVRNNLLSCGMVVLECGGHHGCDTILLARWVGPSGRVVTFEPIAENAAVIHSNLALNGVTNVVVEECAVGSARGEVVMSSQSNASVRMRGGSGPRVPIIALDEYCLEHNIIPDFLKIDVEGYELSVLAGAGRLLREHVPALQIELHCDVLPKYGELPENVWHYIDRSAYDVRIQLNDLAEPVSYQPTEPMRGRVHLFLRPASIP